LDRDLNIKDDRIKANRRQVVHRLKEAKVIDQDEKRAKFYRYVNTRLNLVDYKTAGTAVPLDLKWPLGLETLVKVYPGNIVVAAGSPNAGKTAFNLHFIWLNNDHPLPIYYFCSEMGADELKGRLELFPGLDINDWKFKYVEQASRFQDTIVPDAINIIDFLEMTENLYEVNTHLTAISHKLTTGLAVVSIQKKIGIELGRGAEFGLEKPKLYLSLDKSHLTLVKGKSWARRDFDPNGLKIRFKLVDNCKLESDEDWKRPSF
jgi:hypothetical protein